MDVLAFLTIALALGLLFAAGRDASGGVERAWTGYFRGHRPDPWPIGVQEEDRATRWGVGVRAGARSEPAVAEAGDEDIDPGSPAVTTQQVHAVVARVGSNGDRQRVS